MDLYCSLLDYLNKEIVTKTPLQKEIIWMENISGLLRFRWRIHFLIVFYGIHPQYWICATFLINSYVHAVLSIRNQIIFCERLSRFNLQRTVFWDYKHLEINLQFHVYIRNIWIHNNCCLYLKYQISELKTDIQWKSLPMGKWEFPWLMDLGLGWSDKFWIKYKTIFSINYLKYFNL